MLALNNTRINNYQYFSRMIFYNSINFTPPNPSSSLIKNQNFRCFWFPRCREETGEEISLLWTSHSTVSREKYSKRGELNVWRCQTGTISDASCSISAPLETTYVRIWSIKNSSGERKEKKKKKKGKKATREENVKGKTANGHPSDGEVRFQPAATTAEQAQWTRRGRRLKTPRITGTWKNRVNDQHQMKHLN